MKENEYAGMQAKFKALFDQELTDAEITSQEGGLIGDECLPLGRYIWDKGGDSIEYYVQRLANVRGDCHGYIYKNGKIEYLPTLNQIGEMGPREVNLNKALMKKGLLDIWD